MRSWHDSYGEMWNKYIGPAVDITTSITYGKRPVKDAFQFLAIYWPENYNRLTFDAFLGVLAGDLT
jgi:hypothetical protein